MSDAISQAIDRAFAIGMFQHREEIEPFAQWIAEDVKPELILEIGSWKGGSTLLLGRLASLAVVSIDKPNGEFGGASAGLDDAACFARDDRLRSLLGARFQRVTGDSHHPGVMRAAHETLALFKCDPRVDLLFIDGDHSLDGVRQDWEWYRWLVRPGGWVAFHDVLDTPWQRETGCRVDLLWNEIERPHYNPTLWRAKDNRAWGGIGAVQCPMIGW